MLNCATCNSNLQCASCIAGFSLFDIGLGLNRCMQACPQGLYAIGAVCKPCMGMCKTCSSEGPCTLCLPGFVYTITTDAAKKPVCAAACNPSNSFVDSAQVCQLCPTNCDKCSSATDCLSCTTKFYDSNSNSAATCQACPSGEYRLDNQLPCLNCPFNCAECTSPTQCSKCKTGLYLNVADCKLTCTATTMKKTDDAGLMTCVTDGITATDCGDYFYELAAVQANPKECKKCIVTDCKTCTTAPASCEACKPGMKTSADKSKCEACPAG